MHQSWSGIIGVFIAALLWGTTGTAASLALGVSPIAIAAVSMGCGGLLQASIAAKSIYQCISSLRHNITYLVFGAGAVVLYPLAFYGSMHCAGVAVGTVVSIGSAPLFSAVIENRLEGNKLSVQWLWGALCGIIGIVLLALADSGLGSAQHTSSMQVTLGIGLGLIAGFTYAFYSWSARQLMLRQIPPKAAMGATFGLGGAALMPLLIMTGGPLLASWQNIGVGLYMALFPMFLGYLCYGFGLARIRASTATAITLLEPVVAALLAVLIIGEQLAPSGWLGMGLIILCLVIISMPTKSLGSEP